MTAIIIILGLILFLGFLAISFKNKFVILLSRVKNAWSQIDVQLQRRFDLIPNLVETVKGYATHEKGTLEAVIAARNQYIAAGTVQEKMEANNQLTAVLRQLFAVSETYPDLKANTNFLQLQEQLKEVEDKVAYARQFYNDTVTKYNQSIQLFPASIFAAFFHYGEETLFQATAGAQEAPKVKF